ncbi:MAG: right-handed parallel beta-helix repeat-containing protein [Saprospiraceae bacterium]|nr:right-handed parallel beta-helix repeat-containing protein [Saprospiraceae bacterium]
MRNAISVNVTPRVSGNNPTITVQDNTITYNLGVDMSLGTTDDAGFRAGVATDEGGGTITGNDITTINHDVIVAFGGNPAGATVTGNNFMGGGIQFSDLNAAYGPVNVSNNIFTGAGAPGTAVLRLKNNYNGIAHSITNNTFNSHEWAVSLENMNNVTLDNNTFNSSSPTAHAVVVNTKSISTNSNAIVQVPIGATFTNNDFNGTGTALTFLNHDSDNDSYGTFTLGTAGNENNFSASASSFIVFDSQTGPSNGSTFPNYDATIGAGPAAITTKACWDQDMTAEHNNFDVGSGLQLPSAMSEANRLNLEAKLVHDPDAACLGKLRYYYPVHNVTQNTFHYDIQDAVDAVTTVDGDVIEVPAGLYTISTTITVNKAVTINGPQDNIDPRTAAALRTPGSAAEAIVDGNGTVATIFNITVAGVVLNGFEVRNGTGDLIASPAGSPVKNGVTVKYCIVHNSTSDEGIQLRNLDGGGVEYCRIFSTGGDGIALSEGSTNSFVRHNEVYQSASADGVIYLFDNGPFMLVDDNLIYNNTAADGIKIGNKSGGNANSNSAFANNAIVSNNTVTGLAGSSQVGIYINTSRVNVLNNTITGWESAADAALYLRFNIKQITVSGNTISSNNRAVKVSSGVNAANALTLAINQNAIFGNTYGMLNSSTGVVNAQLNWWGDVSGPSDFGPGTGNSVSSNVNFCPWLDDVPPVGMPTSNTGVVENIESGEYFCSIQTAIADAETVNGNTLEVGSGTFNEQVLVNKGVTIKGVGMTKPTVDFTGTVTGKPTLFDVSVDGVTVDNIRFNVDLSKLRSAVIASGAGIDNITVKDNVVDAYGTPAGSYGDRNAVSINYGGPTNYRVATGGVNSVTFTGNTVNGTGPGSYFRSGISLDEGGGTFTGNTLQTINHDVLVRFAANGTVNISNNNLNGGGVELSDQNAAAGTMTVSNNTFNGAFAIVSAPGAAVLRVKNNYNGIAHNIIGNTFNSHEWAISLENMNNVTMDGNTFSATSGSARAVVVNTKSISSNSNTIVQVPVGATLTNNIFNGKGTALTFQNHDSDNDSYGTFTLGGVGNENDFASTLTNFIVFDGQTGSSNGSTFPVYPNTGGWPTTMACWDTDLTAENNLFDVGGGLELPASMDAADRNMLETKFTHEPDNACLGRIRYFYPVHNVTQNTYHALIQDAIDASQRRMAT